MNAIKFSKNKRGGTSAGAVITLCVAFLVAAYMIPMGLQAVVGGNMTGVDATVKTIFTVLLPILLIIGVALKFVPKR